MIHRRVFTPLALERARPICSSSQKQLFQGFIARQIGLSSSVAVQQPCNIDPHVNVMEDLRNYLLKSSRLTNVFVTDALRRWYPDHTVTATSRSTGILKLAKAGLAQAKLDRSIGFYGQRIYKPASDHTKKAGRLKYNVEFGRYQYCWNEQNFYIYEVRYWENEWTLVENQYIIYPQAPGDVIDGQSRTVDRLITTAAQYESEIDKEVWVFDKGYWSKNRELWKNVQDCKWENVILNPNMKMQLISDIEGFFDRKEEYASFAVPWKRGVLLHGLPGNGKSISIKAIMRSLYSRPTPIPTLYVKSLGKLADQNSIRCIFEKARETSPCLLVLEDVDSLVADDIKSFFLNEIDGLEANDGILMVGSTNYLDRLDPGISKRPSRFDRKYHFALPATPERVQYCEFWRTKLAKQPALRPPPALSPAIAALTEGFSFAYLQEAFVTALLSIVQTHKQGQPLPPVTAPAVSSPSTSTSTSTSASPASQSQGEEMEKEGEEKEQEKEKEKEERENQEVESDPIFQAVSKEILTLRREMRESKKSVEDSGRNSVATDAKSGGGGGGAGFSIGR